MKNKLHSPLYIVLFHLLLLTFSGCAIKHAKIKKAVLHVPEKVEVPWGLTFSPNPVKENITLSFTYQSDEKGTIRIYDALGQEIKKKEIEVKLGSNSIVVPLHDLDKGVYILEAYAGSKQLGVKRITKE